MNLLLGTGHRALFLVRVCCYAYRATLCPYVPTNAILCVKRAAMAPALR